MLKCALVDRREKLLLLFVWNHREHLKFKLIKLNYSFSKKLIQTIPNLA
jgi:hypothetical protein